MTSGQYNSFDVSSYVSGNGTYALAVASSSATELTFVSKEATSNHPPQFSVKWVPPTSTSSTTTTTNAPTTSTTLSSTGDPILAAAGDIACYFGASAGDPSKGYYSYEIGAWHVIVLNARMSRSPLDSVGPP